MAVNSYLSQIDESSIFICSSYKDDTIQRIYGEKLDLSGITIEYENKKHEQKSRNATIEMVSGYNPEYIGRQAITIEFCNVEKNMYVFTSPADIDTPYLEISGKSLFWTSIKHASSYNLYFGTDSSNLSVLDNITTCSYDLTNFDNYGYCYFGVQALKESATYNDSKMSNLVSAYNLRKATNIKYDNGIISWDAVEGATSYTVSINGTKYQGITESNYEYVLDKGTYDIVIEAYSTIENSLYSTSEPYRFELLNSVESISYKNEYLSWNSVINATSYDVYLNDSFYINTYDPKIPVTSFKSGVYKIGIVAKNEYNAYVESNLKEFNCLINFELNVHFGIVSFDNLTGNYTYHLVVDGIQNSKPLSSNSVDCNSLGLTAGEHTIQILVDGNIKLDINLSSIVLITKLSSPTLTIENNHVSNESGLSNVTYYLNGNKFDGNLSNIANAGNYQVTGKTNATADNEIDSDISTAIVVTKLEAPIISIQSGVLSNNNSTRIIQYYKDGVPFDGNLSNITDAGLYNITAKYIASSKNELDSGLSNTITVKKLAKPVISLSEGILSHSDATKTIQYYLNNKAFEGDLSSITTSGVYSITAKYIASNNNELDSELSEPITIRKLSNPSLSIVNEKVVCDDTSRTVKFYLNNVEFDGDLSGLSAGVYTITAKYFGSNGDEIDSEISMITITKLSAPVISMSNEVLVCDDASKTINWYLNGSSFDGKVKDLEAGTYTITAKYISNDSTVLNSAASNSISITKLAAPVIQVCENTISCIDNNINVKYYLDGVEFSGDYSDIPAGPHIVSAKNIGDGSTTITSALSNELPVYRTDVTISVTPITNNRVNVLISTSQSTITYDMKVTFYNGDSVIDSIEYKDKTTLNQVVSYSRNGTIASKIVIEVTVKSSSGNHIITYEYII